MQGKFTQRAPVASISHIVYFRGGTGLFPTSDAGCSPSHGALPDPRSSCARAPWDGEVLHPSTTPKAHDQSEDLLSSSKTVSTVIYLRTDFIEAKPHNGRLQ